MNLKQLRAKINNIDVKILNLLNQRTRAAVAIGKLKWQKGRKVYSPKREAEVYGRLIRLNKGPLSPRSLKAIYSEIMSSALSLQKKLTIAYLGPQATFTHEAARSRFGASVDYLSVDNISGIFNTVEKGYADYGVVPVENSTEGAVTHSLDMFVDSGLLVCAEIIVEISHNLLSREGNISRIKRIYSKSEVFGQCRTWLNANLPQVEQIEVSSTASAAMRAAGTRGSGAIASRLAADLYGLRVLSRDIEDASHNATRFLVIGKEGAGRTGRDKTSVMFAVKDKVGALHDTLKVFKRNNINLTKIESRPSRKKAWEYYFFIDFNAHREEKKVKKALAELGEHCIFVKVLGSYPCAVK